MTLSRRQLLGRGAAGLGIVALGNATALFDPAGAAGVRRNGWNGRGWRGPRSWEDVGPLLDDPAGFLDLPAGFSYRILSRTGDPMPGGGTVPSNHDGTAAFAAGYGGTRLVINHELGTGAAAPAVASAQLTYDPGAGGGTTTLTLDRRGNRIDEYVSLAGTYSNCAGGLTPWGTWLTCEETEARAGSAAGLTKDHGWVFEVDPNEPRAQPRADPVDGARSLRPRGGDRRPAARSRVPHRGRLRARTASSTGSPRRTGARAMAACTPAVSSRR